MIGIITLPHTNRFNYGGVLQNYALYTYLNNNGYPTDAIHCSTYSIGNEIRLSIYNRFNIYIEKKKYGFKVRRENCKTILRNKSFINFINNEIKPYKFKRYTNKTYHTINQRYRVIIVGSDQVWNPFWAVNEKTAVTYFLNFFDGEKVSYAASFGTTYIPENKKKLYKNGLKNFNYLSVREYEGAKIIHSLIGKDAQVVIDPTMLLSESDWKSIEKRSPYRENRPYILKYFLGNQNNEISQEVANVAKNLNCDIYDVSENYDNKFYTSGPREFIDLIDHAQAIYTDSFHAMVFSVLFNKPFVVYERDQDGMKSMSSRIDTFLDKFHLERRYVKIEDGNICLNHKFDDAYRILEEERKKAKKFLEIACRNN